MGKSKLTKELIKQAVKLVENGNNVKDIFGALNISDFSWYTWLQQGKQAKSGLKRELYEEVEKAERRAIMRNVAHIQRAAGEGNWQAAAWWLERKYPDDWGKKERLGFDNTEGLKIVIEKVEANADNKD